MAKNRRQQERAPINPLQNIAGTAYDMKLQNADAIGTVQTLTRVSMDDEDGYCGDVPDLILYRLEQIQEGHALIAKLARILLLFQNNQAVAAKSHCLILRLHAAGSVRRQLQQMEEGDRNMAMNTTRKLVEPRLMLHGRIVYRNHDGVISDVTKQETFGLKRFADDGTLAIHILEECRKRLNLLYMAAEHRSHMDASLLRLAVDDIRRELADGSELAGYIHLTQELFEHSEALLPIQAPDPQGTGHTLTLISQNLKE